MISFAEFLRAVSDSGEARPYPWQQRLASRCADGDPPAVIAVPTGAGKTTTVDVLVWALARQADRAAVERTVGVRIVWAIDRRILVDDVHEHAAHMAEVLAAALADRRHVLHEVASRLADIGGNGVPLVATRWRGGIDRDRDVHGPLQPQVITSTVAQIASRVLFRGYGVSDRTRVLAAGLAGCDTTICLDEAHLALPFKQTVQRIVEARDDAESKVVLPQLNVITLTATPGEDTDPAAAVTLSQGDRDDPELAKRIDGEKHARLEDIEPTTDRERVAELVAATLRYVDEGADSVACVVNTVRCARDIHRQLVAALRKHDDVECGLLIGPQRPHDRSDLLDGPGQRLFDPSIEGKRIVCVATQTFEVGLDADVEALVTESASASALVQRLGRLNRRGNRIGRATIIRDPGRWLYEEDEQLAWDWLSRRATDGVVDVSVAALSAGEPAPKPARRPAAPILSDEIVELLAQPTHALGPWQDLDVEVYWRGAESVPSADVSVCWRGDLRPELLGADGTSYRAMLLELVPPRAEELLTLTVNAARALVAAESLDDRAAASAGKVVFADVDVAEGTAASIAPDPVEDPTRIPFVVLRAGRLLTGVHGTADGGDRLLGVRAIRAGDVILLPARRSPRATGYETFPQTDVAADLAPKGMPAPVRLTPEALQIAGGGFLAESTWKRVASACAGSGGAGHNGGRDVLPDRLVERLAEILPDHPGLKAIGSETLAETRHHLMLRQIGPLTRTGEPDFEAGDDEDDADSLDPADEPEDDESIRTARRRAPTAIDRPVDASWVLVPIPDWQRGDHDRVAHGGNGSPPSLDAHARAVWAELEQSVERVGLSREVRGALRAAALAHDHGKADPRNQAYFRRGVRAIGAEVIAKSVFGTHDPRAHAIAMTLSGLPIGFRHEAESVAVFADAIESGRYLLDEDVDQELILVLILGHHGEGRSFARLPRGGLPSRRYFVDAGDVSGSSGGEPGDSWCDRSLERFWRVNGRYGAWGLAYLQALLMLADRSVSARGL